MSKISREFVIISFLIKITMHIIVYLSIEHKQRFMMNMQNMNGTSEKSHSILFEIFQSISPSYPFGLLSFPASCRYQ